VSDRLGVYDAETRMGINAVWRAESGEDMGRVLDPQMLLSSITSDPAGLSRTLCLRFLDPYGNAVFNQEQLPILAEELEGLAAVTRDKAVREHLAAVAALARKAIGEIHTYLWFIGD
jgi:hypothetical protein